MGNKLVVLTYELADDFGDDNKYHWEEYYRGESFVKALWYMFKAKREGIRCIKLEWRP